MIMGARQTALGALIACRKQGAWSDGALKEYAARDRLDRREAALAARLCYGVLQNRMLLDFWLEGFVRGGLQKLQPVVLDILRLGLYQIVFLDKIPDSAAVDQSVELGKQYANPHAAGLINGVLRAAVRQKDRLPEPAELAVRYSHPRPLVELFRREMGEEALQAMLQANNGAPETVVQVNTLRATPEQVAESIRQAGGSCQAHPWLPGCLLVTGAGSLEQLESFRQGTFYVQDAASRLAVQCVGLRPGMRVLDSCAAPGGKSFAAALEMGGQGTIHSCDIHAHKLALVEKGALRLGLECIHPMLHDGRLPEPEWNEAMDAVLVDAPCSGLGIIRKKPDIRYKNLAELERLPGIQLALLEQQANYVKPGGVLLYSTCTILHRENREVAQAFLARHPEFAPERLPLPAPLTEDSPGMLTLLPGQQETDGFFICKMRRKP